MSAPATVSAETVLLRVEDGVAWITLNRPDRLNAFSGDMRDRLHDAAEPCLETTRGADER